jgi:mannose PTS system EIID component
MIRRSDLWRIFWRSLFIQAGFNPQSMQALGLVYALAPGLRRLYPDDVRRQAATLRHLSVFNTHPYVAAAFIGGILHFETRIASGEAQAEEVERFKQTLMGPLAALGDGFFWLSLRPAVGALACALSPFLGAWSALLFVVLYNVVHLTARAWLLLLGFHQGDKLVATLQRANVRTWAQRLRSVAAFCAGVFGMLACFNFGMLSPHLGFSIAPVAVVTLVSPALERRMNPYVALYGIAVFAMVLAAWLA